MTKINIAVTSGKYDVATIYGPFVHWQAAADWLDLHPALRDGYTCVFIPENIKTVGDSSIDEANKPYIRLVDEGEFERA